MGTIKTLPGLARAHLEARRGTQEQASAYCKKDGLWFELGQMKQNSDAPSGNLLAVQLKNLIVAVKEGADDEKLLSEYTVCCARYPKFIEKVRESQRPALREELEVIVLYGRPGTGKTQYCYTLSPNLYALPVRSQKTTWFNGYQGQKAVLMDDFSGKIGLDELLRLLDRYPIQVEVKGGFTWFNPSTIYITSNVHIDDWYDYSKRNDSKQALKRRISKFLYCERHDFGATAPIYSQQECDCCFVPLRRIQPTIAVVIEDESGTVTDII